MARSSPAEAPAPLWSSPCRCALVELTALLACPAVSQLSCVQLVKELYGEDKAHEIAGALVLLLLGLSALSIAEFGCCRPYGSAALQAAIAIAAREGHQRAAWELPCLVVSEAQQRAVDALAARHRLKAKTNASLCSIRVCSSHGLICSCSGSAGEPQQH